MAAERITGYPLDRFINSGLISEEFICSICQDVLREPQMVTPCEHIFCQTCIEEWDWREGTCPVDRIPVGTLRNPIRPFKNLLNALELWCQYRPQGCTVQPKLGDLEEHEARCQFSPAYRSECPSACGAELTLAERNTHNCVAYLKTLLLAANNRADKAQDRLVEKENEVRSLRNELEEARRQNRDLQQPSTSTTAAARASASRAARIKSWLLGLGEGGCGGDGSNRPCPARFKTTRPYPVPSPPTDYTHMLSDNRRTSSTRLRLNIAPGITVGDIRGTTNRESLTEQLQTVIATVARVLAPGYCFQSRSAWSALESNIEDQFYSSTTLDPNAFWHVVINTRESEGGSANGNNVMRESPREGLRARMLGPGGTFQEIGRFELRVRNLEILITLMEIRPNL